MGTMAACSILQNVYKILSIFSFSSSRREVGRSLEINFCIFSNKNTLYKPKYEGSGHVIRSHS